MSRLLRHLLEDESGQNLADYAVLVGLIAIGIVVCILLIRFLIAVEDAGLSFPSNRPIS